MRDRIALAAQKGCDAVEPDESATQLFYRSNTRECVGSSIASAIRLRQR